MHSNITIKNVSWPHFSWATLYNTTNQKRWFALDRATGGQEDVVSSRDLKEPEKSIERR